MFKSTPKKPGTIFQIDGWKITSMKNRTQCKTTSIRQNNFQNSDNMDNTPYEKMTSMEISENQLNGFVIVNI